jgi:hypothetical protein
VFPALDILAAAGLLWGASTLAAALRRTWTARAQWVAAGAAATLALLNVAWWHPYSIVAFNQTLDGAQAGARTFSVGWGEGYNEVADWLNQQPNITGVLTASIMTPTLQPYLRHGAQTTTPRGDTLPAETGYVVVYIYQAQGTVFPPFDQFYPQATPLHTVTIHDVEYAWIYQAPPPVPQPRPARFGEHIHLRGFAPPAASELRPGAQVSFQLFWQTSGTPPADYWLFAHLLDAEGQRVAQVDLPYPTSEWQRPYITTELPLTLPADAAPGLYRLVVGMYDPADSTRLPLETSAESQMGDDALLLYEFEPAP